MNIKKCLASHIEVAHFVEATKFTGYWLVCSALLRLDDFMTKHFPAGPATWPERSVPVEHDVFTDRATENDVIVGGSDARA